MDRQPPAVHIVRFFAEQIEQLGVAHGDQEVKAMEWSDLTMAKNKIERIDQEIAKTREKIAEQQEKLKDLEAQKTEAENLEIVQMVRALRMTPAQLSAMLSGGMVPGRAVGSANPEQEEMTHEE